MLHFCYLFCLKRKLTLTLMTVKLLTSIEKLTIGRLQPRFLTVCRPDLVFSPLVCGSPAEHQYITGRGVYSSKYVHILCGNNKGFQEETKGFLRVFGLKKAWNGPWYMLPDSASPQVTPAPPSTAVSTPSPTWETGSRKYYHKYFYSGFWSI